MPRLPTEETREEGGVEARVAPRQSLSLQSVRQVGDPVRLVPQGAVPKVALVVLVDPQGVRVRRDADVRNDVPARAVAVHPPDLDDLMTFRVEAGGLDVDVDDAHW